jgi:hypothetical protein
MQLPCQLKQQPYKQCMQWCKLLELAATAALQSVGTHQLFLEAVDQAKQHCSYSSSLDIISSTML